MGVALLFNVLFWLYHIPAEQDVNGSKFKISPQGGYGSGCNIGAFINIIIAMTSAMQLAKFPASQVMPATA
jgi:hypothetical protein